MQRCGRSSSDEVSVKACTMPNVGAIGSLLEMLLGRTVTVTPSDVDVRSLPYAGTYVARDDSLGAVALCDRAFVCWMGSALSLVPPTSACEALKSGELSPLMLENGQEVLNIAASLISQDGYHLRFHDLLEPSSPSWQEVQRFVDAAKERVGVDVAVSGYGDGVFALFAGSRT